MSRQTGGARGGPGLIKCPEIPEFLPATCLLSAPYRTAQHHGHILTSDLTHPTSQFPPGPGPMQKKKKKKPPLLSDILTKRCPHCSRGRHFLLKTPEERAFNPSARPQPIGRVCLGRELTVVGKGANRAMSGAQSTGRLKTSGGSGEINHTRF